VKRLVSDLLFRKPELKIFPCVQEQATLGEALAVFEHTRSSALLVMHDKSMAGIFTASDFARASLNCQGAMSLDSKVKDIMVRKIVYVTLKYRLDECLMVMVTTHIRHLPVLENELPLALLSMRHIVEALVEDQEFMISQLLQYVTGSTIQAPLTPPAAEVKIHKKIA